MDNTQEPSKQTSSAIMLQNWLTPARLPKEASRQHLAQQLVIYLLLVAIVTCFNLLLQLIVGSVTLFTITGTVVGVTLYLLARFAPYDMTVLATISTMLALPYIFLFFSSNDANILVVVFTHLVALLIASQFAPLRRTLQVALVTTISVFILNMLISNTLKTEVDSISIIAPVLVTMSLLVLNAYGRAKAINSTSTIRHPDMLTQAIDLMPQAALIQVGKEIVAVNAAAIDLFGTEDSLVGKKAADIIHTEQTSNYQFQHKAEQLTVTYDDVITLASEQTRKVQVTARSIAYSDQVATMLVLQPYLVEPSSVTSDKYVRALSDMVSDFAYEMHLTDADHLTLVWANDAVKKVIGIPPQTVIDDDGWLQHVLTEDRSMYEQAKKNLLKGDASYLEYRIQHADGSIRWLEDSAFPISTSDDDTVRILGTVQDVTERVLNQEKLRAHVVQQAVVTELGLLALNAQDMMDLFHHATTLSAQVMNMGFSAIFLHHPQTSELECVSVSNEDSPLMVGNRFSDASNQSIAGYTMSLAEPVLSKNLPQEARFKPFAALLQAQYSSALSVNILGDNDPHGVIVVYSQDHYSFMHDEIYFLQSIANVISTFIGHQRARNAEQEYSAFAEVLREATAIVNTGMDLDDVLDQIMHYMHRVVPQFEQASIMLLDRETGLYHHHTTWGFPEDTPEYHSAYHFDPNDFPFLQLMMDTWQPITIGDVHKDPRWITRSTVSKTVSYLAAPIIVQNECMGFIHLHGYQVDAFSKNDALRLKTFADKTGSALVSAQKQRELEILVVQRTRELTQEREQLEAIFAGTGDGIFYTEQDKIAFVNETICKMTGYQAHELVGQPGKILQPDDITPEEMQMLQSITPIVSQDKIWRDTVRLARADGTTFTANLTISRVDSAEKDGLRSVTIVRDISREQEIEELKQRFIATAAHELRSPISSMKTRMYMIKNHPEQLPHHLERLDYIIDRMNRLVSNLLDVASFERGRIILRKESIVLQDVLDIVVDILSLEAEQADLTLTYDKVDEPVMLLADAHRLEQVFINLINNAINYTPTGGSILVQCAVIEDKVKITVKDTGEGIPADEIERIFLPFYRTKGNTKKGTGLGLSITRDIVRLHDGSIHVESVVSQGSTFCVQLPVATS